MDYSADLEIDAYLDAQAEASLDSDTLWNNFISATFSTNV